MYHPGLFQWTHFKVYKEGGVGYLLLFIKEIINNLIEVKKVKFEAKIKVDSKHFDLDIF